MSTQLQYASCHPMTQLKLVREWDAEVFHAKVLDLERHGWQARRESYKIIAEMSPDDGTVIHLHTIELERQAAGE